MKIKKGFSLIETLVVVVMFAVLATIASQSTVMSLRSARKSDSLSDVRDNLDNAVSVMERGLRNSQGIITCTSGTRVDFIDEYERLTYFSCLGMSSNGYISSGSARLTSDQIDIEICSITCTTPASSAPTSVDISLTATNSTITGLSEQDKSGITVDTRVNLRVY